MSNLITRFDEAVGKAVSGLPAENPAKRFELLRSIRSQAASFRAVPESIQTELLTVTIYFVQNDANTLEKLDSLLKMALHQADFYAAEAAKSGPTEPASEPEPGPEPETEPEQFNMAQACAAVFGASLAGGAFTFLSPILIPAAAVGCAYWAAVRNCTDAPKRRD